MVIDLKTLYGAEATEQQKRYEELSAYFAEEFGDADALSYFSAPGRTEVGGNHTDHNNGKVLAAAVNLDVIAAVKKTENGVIRLKSVGFPMDTVDTADLNVQEAEKERSASLIRGVCARLKTLGYEVGGFDAVTTSRVLKGSGLSSSAAFEVLVVTILSHLYNDDAIDPVEAAQISKFAENVYFGKPSGLLDQMAASVGGFTTMDFKDLSAPKIEKIDFDLDRYGYALCVVDTGGNHADLTGEYAAIPAEMKRVAKALGGEVLREVSEEEFYKKIPELRKEVGDRAILRAIHFFDDNRVVDAGRHHSARRAGRGLHRPADQNHRHDRRPRCGRAPRQHHLHGRHGREPALLGGRHCHQRHGRADQIHRSLPPPLRAARSTPSQSL